MGYRSKRNNKKNCKKLRLMIHFPNSIIFFLKIKLIQLQIFQIHFNSLIWTLSFLKRHKLIFSNQMSSHKIIINKINLKTYNHFKIVLSNLITSIMKIICFQPTLINLQNKYSIHIANFNQNMKNHQAYQIFYIK